MTLLVALVLGAFVVSTLPVTAGLLKGVLAPSRGDEWGRVVARWEALDPATRDQSAELMEAVLAWKAASATTLEGDARYLRFQTAFLMFAAFQALVLLVVVAVGLRVLMAPVRRMTSVLARLKAGDQGARLPPGGGPEWDALAHQFNTMVDQNQTLSRLQGWQEVSAFLSHQIKNPLTAIAFAEQNVRSLVPDLPPLAAENLAIIGDQGRRINALVRRLRDLTSFDQLGRDEVDVGAWLHQWAASRRREGEVWNLSLIEGARAPLVLLLWEQAFDNLLANTREAATGPAEVHLVLDAPGDLLRVQWSDANTLAEGVDPTQVGTARFTTKKDGSGLGVFFVRRIAELHGGTLTVGPSPRGGLVFVLTLEGVAHGPHPRRR